MNELSLFTGIGGGLLGTSCLLGWKCIAAVEIDKYCCDDLEQRMKDGVYEEFDLYEMDIREFNQRIAPIYRGKVDVITAGFPCQPFSVAGKRRGDQDERNMWPATIECIRLVQPRYLLLENVPGLLTHEYIRTIYGELAESGYSVKWRCLSAAEVGANHKRNRWWLVADTEETECLRCGDSRTGRNRLADSSQDVANSTSLRSQKSRGFTNTGNSKTNSERQGNHLNNGGWWATEPDVGRLADGVPNRVQRLRAIGNAQVPAVVATVWRLLNERYMKGE